MPSFETVTRRALFVFVLFWAFMFLFGPKEARGQEATKFEKYTYVELYAQTAVEKNEAKKVLTGEYFGALTLIAQRSPKVGLFFETGHGNYWGETVVGPSFQISQEWNVSLAAGVEHFEPKKVRSRFNLYYDQETEWENQGSSFMYLEVGAGESGNWIALDAVKMLSKSVGLGFLVQAPEAGAGVKAELHFGDHVGVWFAPVYDWQNKKTRVLAGGRIMK